MDLDRTVWELRRFCTLDEAPRQIVLEEGVNVPKIRLEGGRLEDILDDLRNPAREPLLWRNCFFGKRARRTFRHRPCVTAINTPLSIYPHIADQVAKYVKVPR